MTQYQQPSYNQGPMNQPPAGRDPYGQHRSEQFQYPKRKSAMAITALVVGIVALLTSFLPIINNLSFILGLLGVIFAIIGLVGTMRGKKSGKGIAIAALIITVLSCVIVLATQSMYSAAIDEATTPTISDLAASSSVDSDIDSSGEASTAEADYSIAEETLDTSNEYNAMITGTFTNNTDKDLSYVQISYNIYDADGAQIGNAYANANDVKAGASWKFEASTLCDPSEIDSYERGDVTAW